MSFLMIAKALHLHASWEDSKKSLSHEEKVERVRNNSDSFGTLWFPGDKIHGGEELLKKMTGEDKTKMEKDIKNLKKGIKVSRAGKDGRLKQTWKMMWCGEELQDDYFMSYPVDLLKYYEIKDDGKDSDERKAMKGKIVKYVESTHSCHECKSDFAESAGCTVGDLVCSIWYSVFFFFVAIYMLIGCCCCGGSGSSDSDSHDHNDWESDDEAFAQPMPRMQQQQHQWS